MKNTNSLRRLRREAVNYRVMLDNIARSIAVAHAHETSGSLTARAAKQLRDLLENVNSLLFLPPKILYAGHGQLVAYLRAIERLDNPKAASRGTQLVAPARITRYSPISRFVQKVESEFIGKSKKLALEEMFLDKVMGEESQRALLYSATLYTWTAFESFATDLWVHALNKYPRALAYPAIKTIDPASNDGLSSKHIEVGLAARHNFDLRKSLGTLLKSKFDFTGVDGILDAYKRAFQREIPLDADALKYLRILEQVRHLIVHAGGRADDYFRRKTRIRVKRGAFLRIDTLSVANYFNAVTVASTELMEFVETWAKQLAAKSS